MNTILALPRASSEDFYERYFLESRPVVVEGAAKAMGAYFRWSDEYLLAVLEDKPVKVRLSDGRFASLPFSRFLAYLNSPSAYETQYGQLYLTDYYVFPTFDEPQRQQLAQDVFFPLPRDTKYAEWMTIYAGPPNSSSSIHQDVFSTHTWLAQLRGEKTWRICAPDSLTDDKAKNIDIFNDAPLPCDVFEATLQPGDVIYLPPNWWHQVLNKTATLSISGNFCSFSDAKRHMVSLENNPSARHRGGWEPIWTAVLGEESHL